MSSALTGGISALGGVAATAASNAGWFIPMLVAALAYFQYEEFVDPESKPINMPTENLLSSYDFIVIGSGSAGAVVAARLSEVENWNILLLEAGGDETEISDVPLMAGYLQLSKLDWQYKAEPSGTFCLGNYGAGIVHKLDHIESLVESEAIRWLKATFVDNPRNPLNVG